ncbi:hypothetical protein ES705_33662 [subsurface metagenome]
MSNKTRNNTIFSKKTFLLILMIMAIFIPVVFTNLKIFPNISLNKNYLQENVLNMNEFTKDNYTEIRTTAKHGLGNITIDDISFNFIFPGFVNENIYHPLVTEDHISGKINMTTTHMEFIETTSPALIDNLNSETGDKVIATYKLNETIQVNYSKSEARYLIYHSRFTDTKLLEFYVNNGTIITELTEGVDYTIDNQNFLVFYYEAYFQGRRTFNFTMYLIWEHFLVFGERELEQMEDHVFEISEVEQEITPEFNYNFFLIARAYDQDLDEVLPITFWDVALTVNPLDKEKFNNHKLMLNGIEVYIGAHLNSDKSLQVKLSDHFTPDSSTFSLNFTSSYLIRFEEHLGNLWAIDRLVSQREIRERIYFCNLISGPRHIYLENVVFYEPAIYFEEVINTYSLFNRDVLFVDANNSISNRLGLNVTIPYLFVGETCPFSIEYFTFQKLKIVITDNIKMPLVGAKIEVFHFGVIYGTYISNKTIQPIIPLKSDENGQIVLYNVPRGNYTIRVYWEGRFVKEASISTFNEINYVYTSIIHSPLWIIIFGGIIGIILILGAIFYLKYKKLR